MKQQKTTIDNKVLKSLTWKYFIKAKITEVTIFLTIIAGGIFIPYFLGRLISYLLPKYFTPDLALSWMVKDFAYFYLGACFLTLIGVVILSIIAISYFIIEWLYGNWEKAESKARQELSK